MKCRIAYMAFISTAKPGIAANSLVFTPEIVPPVEGDSFADRDFFIVSDPHAGMVAMIQAAFHSRLEVTVQYNLSGPASNERRNHPVQQVDVYYPRRRQIDGADSAL